MKLQHLQMIINMPLDLMHISSMNLDLDL